MTKLLTIILLTVSVANAADPFDTVKRNMAEAACVRIEFLSILESDVFDVVDSIKGTALIARYGRFHVNVGTEEYLYDGTLLQTYSSQTNQVIIEAPSGDLFVGSEIALITRLDDYYRTTAVKPGSEYSLTKIDTSDTQLPPQITVMLNGTTGGIDELIYDDVNGDKNRIVFLNERLSEVCPEDSFVPMFPKTAERIRL